MVPGNKATWRASRDSAVKSFNEIAGSLGVEQLQPRPSSAKITEIWSALCEEAEPHQYEDLKGARDMWVANHGDRDLTENPAAVDANDVEQASDLLEVHRTLCDGTPPNARKKKEFRLRSKAFMLTFNSVKFYGDASTWETFMAWVRERAKVAHATQWSAAMEKSLHSADERRVHLHVYFSWLGPKATGVNARNTNDWVFAGVRPRVDVNNENRGPYLWLKATQRGHFYCSVQKTGAIFNSTIYPPWGGFWVPEISWVVSLWKQHKLDHDRYLQLSALLRDGHDRRRASVAAVQATEQVNTFAKERALARELILAKSRPFKVLSPAVECWKMAYEEVEERYQMLVFHGPSQTGKSRLARSLFGEDRTLVVDVQHAEHPDLRGFRRHQHRAIVLDEVASPSFIVSNKKVLQAHVDGAILGQSATQLYTYEVFLWRVPIMLTTNNWDLTKLTDAERSWVETNCVVVHVENAVYEDRLPAAKRLRQ